MPIKTLHNSDLHGPVIVSHLHNKNLLKCEAPVVYCTCATDGEEQFWVPSSTSWTFFQYVCTVQKYFSFQVILPLPLLFCSCWSVTTQTVTHSTELYTDEYTDCSFFLLICIWRVCVCCIAKLNIVFECLKGAHLSIAFELNFVSPVGLEFHKIWELPLFLYCPPFLRSVSTPAAPQVSSLLAKQTKCFVVGSKLKNNHSLPTSEEPKTQWSLNEYETCSNCNPINYTNVLTYSDTKLFASQVSWVRLLSSLSAMQDCRQCVASRSTHLVMTLPQNSLQ